MIYTEVKGLKISKLTLGTAALGMQYGTFLEQQRPDDAESISILEAAINEGINSFDTARGYGDAEQLLGNVLADQPSSTAVVVTKFKVDAEDLAHYGVFRERAYESVHESLRRLNRPHLPICLFHMESSFDIHVVLLHLRQLLCEMKAMGLIQTGGISVDHPMEVEYCIDIPEIEVVQIPINILDQRLIRTGLLSRLSDSGKIIFSRSVFLRGLLFQRPENISDGLPEAVPYLQKLEELAGRSGMSAVQFAFSYIRDLKGITSIVFGAEKLEQVADNVKFLTGSPISPEIRAEAERLFENVSDRLLTPRMW